MFGDRVYTTMGIALVYTLFALCNLALSDELECGSSDTTIHTQMTDPKLINTGFACRDAQNEGFRRYPLCGSFQLTAIEFGWSSVKAVGFPYQVRLYQIDRWMDFTLENLIGPIWSSDVLTITDEFHLPNSTLLNYTLTDDEWMSTTYDPCLDLVPSIWWEDTLVNEANDIYLGTNNSSYSGDSWHRCSAFDYLTTLSDTPTHPNSYVINLYGCNGAVEPCAIADELECSDWITYAPTDAPSAVPTSPTQSPSIVPTIQPSAAPTRVPTYAPTFPECNVCKQRCHTQRETCKDSVKKRKECQSAFVECIHYCNDCCCGENDN